MATTIRGDDNWDTTPPAYGRVVRTAGNVSTTSTSLVEVTGSSITITTGANPIYFGACHTIRNNTVGADMVFNFTIDNALQFGTTGLIQDQAVSSQWNMISPQGQSAVLSAGSHTIKEKWRVGGGTGLLLAGTAEGSMFFVNEIK
tara:strand:- start:279 stop:713 length:435 start_codon:yes stop_codon:yes gene_type:complete